MIIKLIPNQIQFNTEIGIIQGLVHRDNRTQILDVSYGFISREKWK